MIDAVIFDVDGTLVDSVDLHARAWQEAFSAFGYVTRFADVRSQIGKGADQLMPVFVPKLALPLVYDALVEHRSKLFKTKYISKVKAFAKVRELFTRLRADGKQIALASSAKDDELAHYKKVARIAELVEVETSADDVDKSKPHPDIFQAAIQKLGRPKKEVCVVVGDTPFDVIAAKRAKLRAVGMLSGGFPRSQLVKAGAVAIYRDPKDLLAAYQRLGSAAFERG